jgi:hypothetical protein
VQHTDLRVNGPQLAMYLDFPFAVDQPGAIPLAEIMTEGTPLPRSSSFDSSGVFT